AERTIVIANLDITKSAAAQVYVDQQLSYTIVVTNNSSANVTGLVVSDTIPANMTIVPGSISPSGACTFNTGASRLVCNRSMLAPGQSMTIIYAVTFDQQFVIDMASATAVPVTNTASAYCVQATTPIEGQAVTMVRLRAVFLPLIVKNYVPPTCESGFGEWGTGTYPEAAYGYTSGTDEYWIRAQQSEMARSAAPFGSFDEYDVETQARWTSAPVNGDVYGLLFGIQNKSNWRVTFGTSLYAFLVDAVGTRTYTLIRFNSSTGWSDVVAWTAANDEIEPGTTANQLRVSCYEEQTSLYVNDQLLWSGNLPSSCRGETGITSWPAVSANLEARFSAFGVCGQVSDSIGSLSAASVRIPNAPRVPPPE
ncbi:MAG: DUF11 domain-containing protein, partial [Anaerolineae bacterium]|nr:DUF11 domain-containing protein [Anaerolineae bacterium]